MRPAIVAAALVAAAAGLAGCATTRVNAQWADPEFAGRSLRGQTVFVLCDGDSAASKRICQDQLAVQVRNAGATPVVATGDLTVGPPPANDKTLAAARAAGARAVLGARVGPDVTVVSGGPSIGFGIGGFGGSGGRSVTGGSVGIGIPIGGGQAETSYAADLSLTDVATVRLMWTAKVTTPASSSVNAQLGELARVGVETARSAGFF